MTHDSTKYPSPDEDEFKPERLFQADGSLNSNINTMDLDFNWGRQVCVRRVTLDREPWRFSRHTRFLMKTACTSRLFRNSPVVSQCLRSSVCPKLQNSLLTPCYLVIRTDFPLAFSCDSLMCL
ncbi:hypothetical protein P692DRAFT_20829712 [Suillus brevipes Sb2]|nr:hypothetical protein P692DRAFT_20829712 [Suillus brevipes Sb2]